MKQRATTRVQTQSPEEEAIDGALIYSVETHLPVFEPVFFGAYVSLCNQSGVYILVTWEKFCHCFLGLKRGAGNRWDLVLPKKRPYCKFRELIFSFVHHNIIVRWNYLF